MRGIRCALWVVAWGVAMPAIAEEVVPDPPEEAATQTPEDTEAKLPVEVPPAPDDEGERKNERKDEDEDEDDGRIRKIVVMPLQATGVPAALAENLTNVMTFAIRAAAPHLSVMGRSEVERALAFEAQKQLLGCTDADCLADLAGALGADLIVVGSIGKIGSRWIVDLQLLEPTTAKTHRHLSEQIVGDEDHLVEALTQMSANLVDLDREKNLGTLDVRGEGVVRVDGTEIGTAPIARYLLAPGRHHVTWQPRGEERPTGEKYVTVESFTVTRVEPDPIQAEWDTRGLFATFGIGSSPGLAADGVKPKGAGVFRARFGWRFGTGITVHLQRVLFAGQFSIDGGALGIGYVFGGRLRLHSAFEFGAGAVFNGADLGFNSPRQLATLYTLAFDLTYSFNRYFQAGLSAGLNWVKPTKSGTPSRQTGTVLLVFGVPFDGPKHFPQENFYESRWFWGSVGGVVVGLIVAGIVRQPLAKLWFPNEPPT